MGRILLENISHGVPHRCAGKGRDGITAHAASDHQPPFEIERLHCRQQPLLRGGNACPRYRVHRGREGPAGHRIGHIGNYIVHVSRTSHIVRVPLTFGDVGTENSANLLIRRSYVTEGQWDSYYVRGPRNMNNVITNVTDPVTGRTLSTSMIPIARTSVPTTQEGLLAAMQALYFKGRLVIGGGVRRDTISSFARGTMRDPVTNILEEDAAHGVPLGIGANSTAFGVVTHITKNFDLIYSHSNNFNIPNTTVYAFTGTGIGPNSVELAPIPSGTPW